MRRKFDIVIAGVGGQGILLTSNIIGQACIYEGIPVKGAETHGMSQRGGSVEAHIRIGGVYGPKVPAGKADLLLAFEPLEGARYSHYLKKGGIAIINLFPIPPSTAPYPEIEKLLGMIKEKTARCISENFTDISLKIGSVRILNVLMLGVSARFLPLKPVNIEKAIKKVVKKEFIQINLSAFKKGYEYISLRTF